MEKQTLQQQVFDYIKEAAEKIGDFASKEIPPFIEEFLRWKFLEAGVEAIFWMVPVIISLIWFIFYCKKVFIWAYLKDGNAKYADTFWIGLPILFSIIGTVLFFSCFPYTQVKDMIQIKVAPKVYLLEKAAEYLK